MPSPEASRRNSKKSTGPRSPKGKAAVRLNSLSHGAFAKDLLLPGEDAEAFRLLEAGIRAEMRPATYREEFLVQRVILASWRLLRLAGMESRVLRAHESTLGAESSFHQLAWSLILLKWRRSLTKSEPESESEPEPEPEETSQPAPHPKDTTGNAWVKDTEGGNAITKLVRYQNALERSFYRAVKEFDILRQK